MNSDISGKVSAVYTNEFSAKSAIKRIMQELALDQQQISLISPHDVNYERKIEPDTKKVGRSLFKTHLVGGITGAGLGMIGGIILGMYGPTYAQASPELTVLALSVLGLFGGLLVAGLVFLRPDQDAVVNETRQATDEAKWVVVVRTKNHQQTEQAKSLLDKSADSVSSSL